MMHGINVKLVFIFYVILKFIAGIINLVMVKVKRDKKLNQLDYKINN